MSQKGYVKVTQTSEIPTGSMKMIKVGETELLLINVNGKFYAMANRCSHARGNLSKGTLEGTTVTCPRHGSVFDVTSGKSIKGPKILGIRRKTKDLPTYDVQIENEDLFVKVP